ncbi:MAG: hypothetical protein ACLTSX_06270 [Collinsella sp.]
MRDHLRAPRPRAFPRISTPARSPRPPSTTFPCCSTPPVASLDAALEAEVKPTLVKPNLTEINALLGTSYTPEQVARPGRRPQGRRALRRYSRGSVAHAAPPGSLRLPRR